LITPIRRYARTPIRSPSDLLPGCAALIDSFCKFDRLAGTFVDTPKIVRFYQFGGPEVLKLEELPAPRPDPGEVRLKVDAIGLNRAEVMFRSGQYLEQPELLSGLGYEASGTVEEVGAGVTGWNPGDRVSSVPSFSMRKYFTYGDVALLPAYALAR
jgi:NADPH:quinone reductase-like Zn-dependent oxidoreductase